MSLLLVLYVPLPGLLLLHRVRFTPSYVQTLRGRANNFQHMSHRKENHKHLLVYILCSIGLSFQLGFLLNILESQGEAAFSLHLVFELCLVSAWFSLSVLSP